ncbi:hypothetical protein VC889_05995 [Citrobacter freundii]|nr:hypothetical protein [Citrobacter freundii]
MNVYEMEGFLRGKCLPGDMKVNESEAQYLVRKFSELQSQNAELAVQLANAESKCRELAADNAALNVFIEEECFVYSSDTPEPIDANDCKPETPSTNAFLAEVRAQGVDAVRNALIKFVEDEVGPNTNVPGLIRGAEVCVSIADQLRKGAKS